LRIGFFHGYELTGSGSNEYTRYLAKFFVEAGHEIHIICREINPESIPYVTHALSWNKHGDFELVFKRNNGQTSCFLHQLPHGNVHPVFLKDKQRQGNVKSFLELTDEELKHYHHISESPLKKILAKYNLDILHANHLIYQPVAALNACKLTKTPLAIYPHGSCIEYTIKLDERYRELALKGIMESSGLIIGNNEVR